LPYTIVCKAGIRMVRFRVETLPYNGALDLQEEKSFLNSVVQHFRRTGADVIIPASTNTIFRTYPDGAVAAPYGTHVVELTQPEDALWARLSATHRRHVRSAARSGVRILTDLERMTTSHSIIRDTFRKSSLPFMGLEAFDRLLQGLTGNVHLFVADYRGQVQCCAVVSSSQHSGYYMYGGSIPEAVSGAMHLLHWEAMRFCRQLRVGRYDFCGSRINPTPGSKAAGLATFKERFGAELYEGFMWKCGISTLKAGIYSLAVRCLRGGDIVDAEHHKLRTTVASGSASTPNPESQAVD
jgi:lipid II:glycine glycyltransferase (peptidoglycan interpeptide bridge formation enzyme)